MKQQDKINQLPRAIFDQPGNKKHENNPLTDEHKDKKKEKYSDGNHIGDPKPSEKTIIRDPEQPKGPDL